MYTYDFIECPAKYPDRIVEFFYKELFPLIDKYWKEIGRKESGRELALDVPTLANLWTTGRVALFMAYEGEKPVGYVIAYALRPLFFDENVFEIQQYYLPTSEMLKGMNEYLESTIKFLRCSEVWVSSHAHGELVFTGRKDPQHWNKFIRS